MDRMTFRSVAIALVYIAGLSTLRLPAQELKENSPAIAVTIDWHSSYAEAMKRATVQEKMLLVYFRNPETTPQVDAFEAALLGDNVEKHLDNYVFVKLPLDAKIISEGKEVKLLEHGAFAELAGKPGIAVVDLVHRDTEHYGHVVTSLPLAPGKYYRFQPEHLQVALELPPGTHTQRTMVFAVRIHPEAPESTKGEIDKMLLEEACNHCDHQARIRVQGHHNWGWRFQNITGRLPKGLHAQEVVAESWPHETIVDAAVDCVHSWRQSSGHWSAVRAAQPKFGYDMRRGNNGIWYATGLFGNRH